MRSMLAPRLALRVTALLACTALAACGSPSESTTDTAPSADTASWTSVGFGVAYQRLGDGDAVLIAYGGYSAQLSYSEGWARELWRAKLQAMGVGHVYAVQGPRDASYAGDEIANTKLRAHLANGVGAGAPFMLVVAHSSGAFVAHELLRQLHGAGDDATLGKTVYANLDAGGSGFDATIASKLRRVAFVSARDASLSAGTSANASAARSLGDAYSAYGKWQEVVVHDSGCHSGARWCLHDVLVTHRPHRPDFYDLKDDYTDFAGRQVTTEYIDSLETFLR